MGIPDPTKSLAHGAETPMWEQRCAKLMYQTVVKPKSRACR